MEKTVRLGIVGLSWMGMQHLSYLIKGEIKDVVVAAVCNHTPEPIARFQQYFGNAIPTFLDAKEMFQSGLIDAVLIVTPHYSHPELAIEAFQCGLHVLCEKPAGGYTKQVRRMNEAAQASGKVFSMMFQQRTDSVFRKVFDIVQGNQLGELKRINWIITDCYRSDAYYKSSPWRATWQGEGGGVLPNQVSHQLDLLQWICGMPRQATGFCRFGAYHSIETEDDVTAYFEFDNGATGTVIASTGEAPGTNRLEIAGTKGKLVAENHSISLWLLDCDEREFNATNENMWGKPQAILQIVETAEQRADHKIIVQNFVNAILYDEPLIAPGKEGIRSLSISNAIQLSTWVRQPISIPVDENMYLKILNEKIAQTGGTEKT